jgi:hypothetical protein
LAKREAGDETMERLVDFFRAPLLSQETELNHIKRMMQYSTSNA